MLDIPPDWKQWTTAHVVTHILCQAQSLGRYPEAASAMVRSAIDFMLSGPRWSQGQNPISLIQHPNGWQLNAWRFHILPKVDDESVDAIAELSETTDGVDILVPPWSRSLLRRAVRAQFPNHPFDVLGVDDFCQYRLLWTGIDLNQNRADSIRWLLTRYNHLTQNTPTITLPPSF